MKSLLQEIADEVIADNPFKEESKASRAAYVLGVNSLKAELEQYINEVRAQAQQKKTSFLGRVFGG